MKSPLLNILKISTIVCYTVSLSCNAKAKNSTINTKATAITKPQKRPYFNDKKLPDAKDLEAIQELLKKNKDKARNATVCIQAGKGSGSGVIVSKEGLILTAAHVITEVNKEITVNLENGKKLKARSLGLHASTDAAMVQITEKGTYPYINIESQKKREDSTTKLGDWVFSLGHSGGFDKERGSGLRLGRLVRIAENTIQSDCTLIGGDSGGPLFDMNGILVGIHSRVGASSEVNLHIPMHVFHTHWDALKTSEFIGNGPFAQKPNKIKSLLGITVEKVKNGLNVIDVNKGSSAEKSGVKKADVITKADDKIITKKAAFIELIKNKPKGEEMSLTLLRKGKIIKLKIIFNAK